MGRTIGNWVGFIGVMLILLYAATSCNVKRHVEKDTVKTDSTASKYWKEQYEKQVSENSQLRSKIRELEYLGISFENQDCPQLNVDSLERVLLANGCQQSTVDSLLSQMNEINRKLNNSQAQVKVLKNGEIELKGQIKSINHAKQRDEETIEDKNREIKELRETKENLEVQLEQEKKTKTVDVEKTPLAWNTVLISLSIILLLLLLYRHFFYKPKNSNS